MRKRFQSSRTINRCNKIKPLIFLEQSSSTMENIGDPVSIDFAKLENQLRDKLIELQLKTKNLEETQRELAETRQLLYERDRSREEERREAELVQSQLEVATSVIRRWEEEKTFNRCQQVQTSMHSKTIMKERDSLLNQTKNLQLENMILKQKIHELETINESKKPRDDTLNNMTNRVSVLVETANSEISRLRTDVEVLQKSVGAVNKLNGRLQAAGMCSHAIQQKYKRRIEELEKKLNSMTPFKQ